MWQSAAHAKQKLGLSGSINLYMLHITDILDFLIWLATKYSYVSISTRTGLFCSLQAFYHSHNNMQVKLCSKAVAIQFAGICCKSFYACWSKPQPSCHIPDAWAAKLYVADVQCNVLHGLLFVHKRVLPQGSLSHHECCEWQSVEHMMERCIFSEDENLPLL